MSKLFFIFLLMFFSGCTHKAITEPAPLDQERNPAGIEPGLHCTMVNLNRANIVQGMPKHYAPFTAAGLAYLRFVESEHTVAALASVTPDGASFLRRMDVTLPNGQLVRSSFGFELTNAEIDLISRSNLNRARDARTQQNTKTVEIGDLRVMCRIQQF